MTDATHPTLGTAIHTLRHNWGWFVGLGALSIIAGIFAASVLLALVMDQVKVWAFCLLQDGRSRPISRNHGG